MPQANQQLASLFQEMADVLQIIGGDPFRIRAFEKVARVLEMLELDITQIGPDVKKLEAIEGIGKGSATRIAEFLQTGRIHEHDELLREIPPTLRSLLKIPGMGPKTIALLWKELGVRTLEDLRQALASGKVAQLHGMGPKKVETIQKNLEFVETAGKRVRIGQALPMAQWFVEQLRLVPGVKEVAYGGSLRRGRETIGDIDLLVGADAADAAAISDAFVKLAPVGEVLAKGPTKTSIRTRRESGESMQVDLRIVPPAVYGAALLYFTGSKEHNIALRERAIGQGLKLSEYGLTRGDKLLAGKTEEEVYQALGLAWIPPELRENAGEIALAEKDKLPVLLRLEDIKAELHAHTTASDGKWSIRELAMIAAERGFHTVAITDHSKSQFIANGLSDERLEEHIEAIRAVAKELKGKIHVLAGAEVDILSDGSLDYSNSLLRQLDIVVASPHAALSQEPRKATARLLKAINNPYVTILGHPTGRLVNRREGLHPDMPALIAAVAERGIAMEINANHYRLDLRDTHARLALEAGVKLAINTDAHSLPDLGELTYGVLTARRAGATKHDVINCMSKEALAKWIAGTRKG